MARHVIAKACRNTGEFSRAGRDTDFGFFPIHPREMDAERSGGEGEGIKSQA